MLFFLLPKEEEEYINTQMSYTCVVTVSYPDLIVGNIDQTF